MKSLLISIACLLLFNTCFAQAQKKPISAKAASGSHSSLAAVLESKTRKAWEDYKNRKKEAFAAILAPGFSEVTNEADGIFGKDTELSEMDHFALAKYDLKDFKVRPLGNSAALVTYNAEYSGSYDNSPVNIKTVYGEVWTKIGGGWKLLWTQETKLK
jgi:hypothetical protein